MPEEDLFSVKVMNSAFLSPERAMAGFAPVLRSNTSRNWVFVCMAVRTPLTTAFALLLVGKDFRLAELAVKLLKSTTYRAGFDRVMVV